MASIGIFGAGYVGLVTGACFAELGHDVVVRDVVPERIDALRRGEVPIYEPGLEELLERNSERLDFTLDVREAVAGAEFIYICVGTPPTYSGDADLSAVWTVIDELQATATATASRVVAVMKSTVPVGTGENVRAALDYGGSCFPKDSLALKQLAANSGYHFQLLNAVIEVNELQKRRVIAKLEKHLGKLRGKRVALLGLAFKPHTDDMREAPSLVLASRLLAAGAEVRCWDPVADATGLLKGFIRCDTPLQAADGADAVVIVTEWPELRGLDLDELKAVMRTPVLVDGRNFLEPDAVRAAGLVYEGIGRMGQSSFAALPETSELAAPDLTG